MMTVRAIAARDRAEWVRMRDALWPGSLADHEAETRAFFEQRRNPAAVWVAEADGQVVGFLELEYRSYAEGCTSSPVPYIEGWFVDPSSRGQGIGRAFGVGRALAFRIQEGLRFIVRVGRNKDVPPLLDRSQ